MSSISSGTTSTTTLVHSGDTTGSLVFKTNDTGSGGTTAITIDTSQNVGIGGNINLGGANTSNSILTLQGKASTRNGILEMGNYGTTGNDQTLGWTRYFDSTTENAAIEVARASSTSTAYMKFSTNGGSGNTERMRIDSSGRVTMPYQPMFHVKLNITTQYTTVGDIQFTQTLVNVGSYYSTSTYRFTAPVAGTYIFFFKGFIEVAGRTSVNILVNGSAKQGVYGPQNQGDMVVGQLIYTLSANDYVTAYLRGGTLFGDGGGTNYDAATFSGFLIG